MKQEEVQQKRRRQSRHKSKPWFSRGRVGGLCEQMKVEELVGSSEGCCREGGRLRQGRRTSRKWEWGVQRNR